MEIKNIIDNYTASLLLYGEVSDEAGDGKLCCKYFVEELMWCDRDYDKLQIRINSVGGDVYSGIAIFNAIRNCKSEVTILVDGIAASIAGVIALCGRRVEMSKYSRLMIHCVSGGVYGNKDDLKDMISTIESLEDTLAGIISAKCGKTVDEIKALYFDGKDHWLRAEEALELGLIDAIYDVEPIPLDSSTDDVYKIINNRLEQSQQQPQNDDNMNFEEIKKLPRFQACADEAAVVATIQETAARADQADALEAERDALQAGLATAQADRDALQAEVDALDTAAIDAAVADGRLAADQKPVYENLIKADRQNGRAALAGLKPKKMVKGMLEGQEPSGEGPWQKRMVAIKEARKK